MKDRMHFSNSFISLKVFCERYQVPPLISKLTKKLFTTNHITLKTSIRSSFSKIGSKNSLLGRLLMGFTSSVAPSTSNIIVRTLNVRTCSTSTSRNLPFETVTYTVKHEKTCSFCQKPESLHIVNNSAIAKLCGIKLIQQVFESKLVFLQELHACTFNHSTSKTNLH